MIKLTNYSLETENTVLLCFEDGSEKRVPLNHIGEFVAGNDLKKIQGALKIRKSFFKRHLPRASIAVVASGLATLAGMTHQQQLNHLIHPTNPTQSVTSESSKAAALETISLKSQAETLRKTSPSSSPSPGTVAGAKTTDPIITSAPSVHQNHTTHPKHRWLTDVMNLNLHKL